MSLDRSDDFIRANNFSDQAERMIWKNALLGKLATEIRKASRSCTRFLISSEHFHSRLQTVAEVEELHAFLSRFFDDFEVICYLRRQDQMALSRYSEALRAGLTPDSTLPPAAAILEKRGRLPPLYNFETLLQRWAQPFGAECIRARVYSRSELCGGDIVHDFIATAGLGTGQPAALKPSNPAMSAAAQATLLHINRRLGGEDRKTEIRLRKQLAAYLEQHAPGESLKPTAAEAREFFEFYQPSNIAVARRYFHRESLFDEDFSSYPTERREISDDTVLDLLTGFMLAQLARCPPEQT